MDEAHDARVTKITMRFLLVLLGATVSLAAILAVIQRWHAFKAITKCEAIAFLFMLVAYPIFEIEARRKYENGVVRFSSLICGYSLILLAIMVFAAP